METDIETKSRMKLLRLKIREVALDRKELLDEQRRYRVELYKLKEEIKKNGNV